jgi:hypothetical protein
MILKKWLTVVLWSMFFFFAIANAIATEITIEAERNQLTVIKNNTSCVVRLHSFVFAQDYHKADILLQPNEISYVGFIYSCKASAMGAEIEIDYSSFLPEVMDGLEGSCPLRVITIVHSGQNLSEFIKNISMY